MLKSAILLLSIFFLVSCQSYVSQSKEAKEFEEHKQELKEGVKKASNDFGLTPLSDKTLSDGDMEIRFYRFGNSYIKPVYNDLRVNKSVFILKQVNSEWSANIIREMEKSQPSGKRIIEQLYPKSDWEDLFQQLVYEQILTVSPDQDEANYPDATFYLIETNIDHRCRLAFSSVPNEAGKEEGSKQMANLFNIVAKEFDISDFQAPAKLFE